jgi:hypothetical protein
LTKQRLIPLEAVSDISNTDDCPRTLHRLDPGMCNLE